MLHLPHARLPPRRHAAATQQHAHTPPPAARPAPRLRRRLRQRVLPAGACANGDAPCSHGRATGASGRTCAGDHACTGNVSRTDRDPGARQHARRTPPPGRPGAPPPGGRPGTPPAAGSPTRGPRRRACSNGHAGSRQHADTATRTPRCSNDTCSGRDAGSGCRASSGGHAGPRQHTDTADRAPRCSAGTRSGCDAGSGTTGCNATCWRPRCWSSARSTAGRRPGPTAGTSRRRRGADRSSRVQRPQHRRRTGHNTEPPTVAPAFRAAPTIAAPLPPPPRPQQRDLTPLAVGAGVVAGAVIGATIADLHSQRRETIEGGRTIYTEPDRIIVRDPGGLAYVRGNDLYRFRYGARDIRTDTVGGETRTVVIRPDGSEIITVVGTDGRLMRRIRRDPRGREVVIIDNSYRDPRAVGGFYVDVPPPVVSMPYDRYIVDARGGVAAGDLPDRCGPRRCSGSIGATRSTRSATAPTFACRCRASTSTRSTSRRDRGPFRRIRRRGCKDRRWHQPGDPGQPAGGVPDRGPHRCGRQRGRQSVTVRIAALRPQPNC